MNPKGECQMNDINHLRVNNLLTFRGRSQDNMKTQDNGSGKSNSGCATDQEKKE
jgi:hypothetical protein